MVDAMEDRAPSPFTSDAEAPSAYSVEGGFKEWSAQELQAALGDKPQARYLKYAQNLKQNKT
jgi:hypothetical protein